MATINKKQFVEIINWLKDRRKREERLNKAIYAVSESIMSFDITAEWEDKLLSLLETMFDDDYSGWISYYIYELEFGKKDGNITRFGRCIKLKTPANLYDLLVDNEI